MRMTSGRTRAAIAAAGLGLVLVGAGGGIAAASPANKAATVEVSIADSKREGEIRALFAGWNRALATLDPGKVADRYAPDAILLPTVSNKVRSDRAGIVDYFAHFLKNKPQGTILESHVTILSHRAAIDTGIYRFSMNGGASTVDARYTFVYERIGGKWLIVNHHSSAMPER